MLNARRIIVRASSSCAFCSSVRPYMYVVSASGRKLGGFAHRFDGADHVARVALREGQRDEDVGIVRPHRQRFAQRHERFARAARTMQEHAEQPLGLRMRRRIGEHERDGLLRLRQRISRKRRVGIARKLLRGWRQPVEAVVFR